MTINTKLTESFRAQIKNIFKESADLVANAAPPAPAAPPVPPTSAPVAPDAMGAGAPVVPQEEEQKVTLTVSLLKSLLDWVNGEEEPEEGTDDGTGTDDSSAPMDTPPADTASAPVTEQVAPPRPLPPGQKPLQHTPAGQANAIQKPTMKEEAPVAPPTDDASAETSPEGEGDEEDSGVDPMDIEALVNKVAELGQTKPLLTDEDFGEIVAAVDTSGEGDLSGVLDDGGTDETTPPAPTTPPMPVKEDIGQVQPKPAYNNGNKGIQNPTNKGKPV